jgi:hypothetical protein
MTHTAACHIRNPAYRHKMNTTAPSISAAEMVTVKAHHLLSMRFTEGPASCYPTLKVRRVLRRSQRARNRHFSHTPAASMASPPQAHTDPLRHPVNLRPMLITSCHRSLAFRKVRDAKNAASPDTIGSGNTAFPSGSLGLFEWVTGLPAFIQFLFLVPSLARPVPYRVPHGPGALVRRSFISRALWCSFRFLLCFVHRLPESSEQRRCKEDI